RDLADYLSKNRDQDELATNVLGACLNLAADNARVKASTPWQAGFEEWDRRNYLLDHGHPGWRRWGTRWETEDEHKAREAKKEELRRASDEQGLYVNRLIDDADSLMQQQQNAYDAYNAFAQARGPPTLPTPPPTAPVPPLPTARTATTNPAVVPVAPRIKGPLLPRDLYDQPGER